MKLVVSEAHEGIKAAVSKVLCASCQRCRVHFMRNVLAYMTLPREHRANLHSTNPIELDDEWAVQRARYMTLETISQMSDDPLVSLPAVAS